MQLKTLLIASAVSGLALVAARQVSAQHEHGGGGHAEHAAPAPRPEPPHFAPHPPGIHPKGATFRSHPLRVLAPRAVAYGGHTWRHWAHPEFVRPNYYWDWGTIHTVSCIAEDSYGDQYPVSESTFAGFGLGNMTSVEDDALDRCYQESGSDNSCYLATCSHY